MADATLAGAPPRPSATFSCMLREVLREHLGFIAICLTFILGSALVGPLVGWHGTGALGPYYRFSFLFFAVYGLLLLPVVLFRHRRRIDRRMREPIAPAAAWARTWRACRRSELAPNRVWGFAIFAALLPPFLATFSAWKSSIPSLQPFAWDQRFMMMDRALHGGADPWRLLQPVLGSPGVTRAMDLVYGAGWLTLVTLGTFLIACAPPSPLRRQFLVAYPLLWILFGSGAAMLFSSAGPCYYARVLGLPSSADPYAALLTYLDSVNSTTPLVALNAQRALWQTASDGSSMIGSGISEMPSLHIASATMIALCAARASRAWGVLLGLITLVILVGSVHLGWHYAIDGYAGAAGAAGLWWAVGIVVRRKRCDR